MAMVINTNEQSTRIHSIYNKNIGQMNAAMTRIATAQKINSAKDGAANWAISEKMRERIRANDQANQNIQNDTALLKTAQDGFGNTLDVLQTLKERAINAANDANISSDRVKISEEVKQLVAQIDDNAAKVKFNGRQLLNGASETSATTAATATKKTAATANVNAVTATEPQGTHSVYSIQGLKVYDTNLGKLRDIANNTSNATTDLSLGLTDLKDADGQKLFKNGDKITISWNDNGEAKEASYTVIAGEASGNSTVQDLVNFLGASGVAAESFGTATLNNPDSAVGTGITNTEGTALTAASAGIYFFAKDSDRKITDVAISVTNSAETDTSRLENTNAVLEPVGVMQNASNGGNFTEGSNNVYAITNGVASGSAGAALLTSATGAGNETRWMDLLKDQPDATTPDGKEYLYDAYVTGGTTDTDSPIELKINDKTVTFKAGSTINQLNKLLADNDINARFHMAATNEVLTYDGKEVTKGDSTSTATLKAQQAGLYLIAGEGEVITEFNFVNSSTDDAGATISNVATYAAAGGANNVDPLTADKMNLAKSDNAFSKQLGVANDYLNGATSTAAATAKSSSTVNNTDSMLPQGETLQFFVGGEANFGIDFSFGKATVENLFGMTGDKFASLFKDKEGAEEALTYIDDAINKTLVEQTRLGAMEARLGYTSENLSSMNTNLESGVSAYRDADLAKEMTTYMKYSVMSQSSQYMLAQATQNPFSVLQLLQP